MTSLIPVAVRWDAYSAIAPFPDPTNQAQTAIGFSQHRHSAPWFSQSITPNVIQCVETQANMDTELQLAKQAGIKCWAYNWYQPEATKPMMNAWRLHQSSAFSADCNWCVLDDPGGFLGTGLTFSQTALWQAQMAVWVTYFQYANYQKVPGNRPLVFILWSDAEITGSFGGNIANFATMLTYLNGLCATAGLGNVYMVLQGQPGEMATNIGLTGASAIGSYTMGTTVITTPNEAYTKLDTAAQAAWTTYASQGVKMVPTLMTGWWARSERERPFTWQLSFQSPFLYYDKDFAAPTPTQFASHAAAGIAFTEANASVIDSTVMFIYAWSECSESGNPLIPTLTDPPVNTDGSDPIATSNLLIAAGAQFRTVA
jgi:hypothetical protein